MSPSAHAAAASATCAQKQAYGGQRWLVAAAAVVLALGIAYLDWLLPSVQMAYLQIVPVLLVAGAFGLRAGILAAVLVTPPTVYLEYRGAFRETDSYLPANIAIMAAVLTLSAVLFAYFQRAQAERGARMAAEEREAQIRALALSEERYRLVGESLPGTLWTATADGRLDHIGGASRLPEMEEGLLGERWLEIVHPDDRERAVARWTASLADGSPYEIQFRILMGDGTHRWHLVRALPQRDDSGAISRWVGVNVDIDDQRRADEERERIVVGLRALAEAATAMYGSLDYEETLQNIAEAVARTFATCCAIDIIGDDGTYRRVAFVHARPDIQAAFAAYSDQRRFIPEHPVVQAIRLGLSTCVTQVGPEWKATQVASVGEVLDRFEIRSFITVPVRASDGSVLGALTSYLERDAPRASYVAEDLPFAEELGRRAGIAVEHARAYEREHTIAVRFQEASLPHDLPGGDGVSLSSDYRPGNGEATIGGDWYDAFRLADGRIAVSIGDILGKGLDAAVTMARVRQTMRAAASLSPSAVAMLASAESALGEMNSETYATAVAAIFDPLTRRCTFAAAGHPPPLVIDADGSIEEVPACGMMLGMGIAQQEELTVELAEGTTVVFYTDGLVEATRDIDEGHRRLRAAVSDPVVAAAENRAQAIAEHVLRGSAVRDDVAVLVIEIAPRTPRVDCEPPAQMVHAGA